MEEAVNEAKQAAAILEDGKAERILEKLKKGIGTAFPEIPKTSLRIKYVPEEMQEHLSPAFYMIPAIDYTEENVIYVKNNYEEAVSLNSRVIFMKDGKVIEDSIKAVLSFFTQTTLKTYFL